MLVSAEAVSHRSFRSASAGIDCSLRGSSAEERNVRDLHDWNPGASNVTGT
jgi:hypothetical protein